MTAALEDPFALVIGQERAVAQLRAATAEPVHAYLFVGPRGAGKRRAALALAGEWVGDPGDRARSRRLAAEGDHPDIVMIEPEGNIFSVEEAERVIVEASRSPVEGPTKVIVINRFHDAGARPAVALLKPIEEPPSSTRFVLLAEFVPPEHVTIASRSTRVDFPAVTVAAIADALVARGLSPEAAVAAAEGSGGDVGRAELLASDEEFAARQRLWRSVPERLDGSGYQVSKIVSELRKAVEQAQKPLDDRHELESEALAEIEEAIGTRGSGRKAMLERHRREARLHRTDELRMGLATLAHRYRESGLETGNLDVFDTLGDAAEALIRNPDDELWLTALLLNLPHLED